MEYFVEPLVLRIASSAKQIKVAHGIDNYCCFKNGYVYLFIFINTNGEMLLLRMIYGDNEVKFAYVFEKTIGTFLDDIISPYLPT